MRHNDGGKMRAKKWQTRGNVRSRAFWGGEETAITMGLQAMSLTAALPGMR